MSFKMCNCNIGWGTRRTRFKTAWKLQFKSSSPALQKGNGWRHTELLYWMSIQMRCDRPFDSFCMIFAKLIVEKKFRQEYSITCSTSSSCFSPFGRFIILTTVWRGARCMASSGLTGWGIFERFRRQYRKKLPHVSNSLWEDVDQGLSYLFSGESALEITEADTSCRPNIFRINKRQFVSSKCCPKWWNFITSTIYAA